MNKLYFVYILASRRNGTLYIGVTSDLKRRVRQHKQKCADGFTSRYNVDQLVYIQTCHDPYTAISHEKRLKKYPRQWKINLIEKRNPQWKDLYDEI